MRLSLPDEPRRILRISASGGSEQVLFTAADDIWPTSWSSDGKFLLFNRGKYVDVDLGDVWALPLYGNSQPFPVATESFPEGEAKFSPDGKWIALASAPSGTLEIFILPFDPPADPAALAPPQRRGRWQVSVNGGQDPEWRGDGKELFYLAPDGSIMAVEIAAADGSLSIGAPTRLVASASALVNISVDPLDAAPDGDWFLVATSTTQGATPITLVTNWPAAMKMP
jgi:Tol biopolymer transport system component